MEFGFNVNNILGDEITQVDKNLRPFRNNHASSTYRSQLSTVIDDMGVASAKAQGLNGAITTASKLTLSDHRLYIMKDGSTSNGNGCVVGILRVGCRKLFLYDSHGNQHETDPLCVLDFYVHESRQRMGCGKKLFEAMLQAEAVKPVHLAVDRPSAKFSSFLARHYGLKAPVKQVNNFVIFDGFFRDRPAEPATGLRQGKPPVHPYRQNSVDRWQHQIESAGARHGLSSANVQTQLQREAAGCVHEERVWDRRHGSSTLLAWSEPSTSTPSQPTRKEVLKNVLPRENSADGMENMSNGKRNSLPGSPVHRAMGAQQNMYSRHPEVGGHQATPETIRPGTPPMLRRDGPSKDYLAVAAAINAHKYQDRRGHLIVTTNTSPTKESPSKPPTKGESSSRSASTAAAASQLVNDSSWNVLGVPRSATRSAANARQQHTQLW